MEATTTQEPTMTIKVEVKRSVDRRAARRAASRLARIDDVIYIGRTATVPTATWDRINRGEYRDHEMPINIDDFEVVG